MCKRCLIFGSGFGLYGYLPAAIKNGYKVFLPECYSEKIISRKDLNQYQRVVNYYAFSDVDTTVKTLKEGDLVVIAKRPEDQLELLHVIFRLWDKVPFELILEKPLSFSPKSALELCRKLEVKAELARIRMGYTFLYTVWGNAVREMLQDESNGSVFINWLFEAHHFKNNVETWKRDVSKGGGPLRFYGIQMIGLIAICQRWKIEDSVIWIGKGNIEQAWDCRLRMRNKSVIIHIDTRSVEKELFLCRMIRGDDVSYEYKSCSPFDNCKEENNDADVRVGMLDEIIQSFVKDDIIRADGACIKKSIDLWKDIENNTIIREGAGQFVW